MIEQIDKLKNEKVASEQRFEQEKAAFEKQKDESKKRIEEALHSKD